MDLEMIAKTVAWLAPLVVSAVALAKTILLKRLTLKWEKEKQETLEELKNEFSKEQMRLESLLSIQSNNCQAAQARRIQAVEEIWKKTIEIRDLVGPVISVTDILLRDEYARLLEDDFRKRLGIADMNFTKVIMQIVEGNVEASRFAVSPETWSAFFRYRSFMGRSIAVLSMAIDRGEVPSWHDDRVMLRIIDSAFNKEEASELAGSYGGFLRNVSERLEDRIYACISDEMSGKTTMRESREAIKELFEKDEAIRRELRTEAGSLVEGERRRNECA